MSRVLIIAEAGVNHNADIEIAKKLVDVAKDAGADIVKFQTFDVNEIVSKFAEMAEYQKENIGVVKSQREMLSELCLKPDDFVELIDYCSQKEIRFLSTPFDLVSIDFLAGLGMNIWKIPSGEITNYPYLVKIAKRHEKVILSTGMSTLDEVEAAIKVLNDNGAGKISLLHCTTEYPAPFDEVNLKAMETMRNRFNLEVGYSDHTPGTQVSVAAVALGAAVIEKHFTLDKNMQGPDHKASLEPDELKKMISEIRSIEKAIGDGIKKPASSEMGNMAIARKSIVAKRNISCGEIFTEDNLTTKRPGSGISPMLWNTVIGTKAKRNFGEDELIEI